ncbi:AraC family transcriptional regulator [Maricurvus nonylphenolicus]|uniref:AraC family transcriptional regulator n=1 Tax=Maricurvus nonylphenolicus TaxID=1008307 RepID=UPI0036F1C492
MSEQYPYSLKFALDGLVKCGVDIDLLFKTMNVDSASLLHQSAPISSEMWCQILDEAIRQTGNPNIGLTANLHADLADYGPLGFTLLNAENMQQVLRVMCTYVKLSQTGLEVDYRFEKDNCIIDIVSTDWRVPVHRAATDWAITCGIAFVRSWCRNDWSPDQIQVMYEKPDDTAIYDKSLDCPVLFGQPKNAVIIKREVLKQEKPDADHRLFNILQDDLNNTLAYVLKESSEQVSLISKIQREIASLISNGAPSLDQVASKLHMSARTLQRRLGEEGCTFKQLTEETRCIMAKNYIDSYKYSSIDIAFLLGYSEVSAFSRAFRRWTGLTPMQYQERSKDNP